MKLIFGTTSKRKVDDLQNIINEMNLDIQVLSMKDIGWDRGEIDENGETLEENSLIKAKALLSFCKEHNLEYPIITDDAGLFVDYLNGEPGVYTSRYADDEIEKNPELPKYQCIIKLLRKLEKVEDRSATYKCCVTTMMPNGKYRQVIGESKGSIVKEISCEIKPPYFYRVFMLEKTNIPFSELKGKELDNTYRYNALRESLRKL